MKIFWSPLAVERLESIYNYIANENIPAAQEIIIKIFERVETLIHNSDRGRVVPETGREEIRELFESGYRIIYKSEKKRVTILTLRSFKQILPLEELK